MRDVQLVCIGFCKCIKPAQRAGRKLVRSHVSIFGFCYGRCRRGFLTGVSFAESRKGRFAGKSRGRKGGARRRREFLRVASGRARHAARGIDQCLEYHCRECLQWRRREGCFRSFFGRCRFARPLCFITIGMFNRYIFPRSIPIWLYSSQTRDTCMFFYMYVDVCGKNFSAVG